MLSMDADALGVDAGSQNAFIELDYTPLRLSHLAADNDEPAAHDGVLPVMVSSAAMELAFDPASYLGANSMVRATRSAMSE